MFRVIVVPRHAIIAKESEELLPILLKALLALRGHFALPLSVEKPPVKSLHSAKMLIEEVFLQTMAIDGIDNLLEQCAELLYYLPQFIVVRILQHIIVEIAHEMNQALLLRAVHRIVCWIEVRDQDSFEPLQELLHRLRLAALAVKVDDVVKIAEYPDVTAFALRYYRSLVGVN
jgi:hypothetical protein